jgi:hypothetical protein
MLSVPHRNHLLRVGEPRLSHGKTKNGPIGTFWFDGEFYEGGRQETLVW